MTPATRALADPVVLAARRARLHEPHVAPLDGLAAQVERTTGRPAPRVDPASGGTGARVLLLLETPSVAGTFGSGLISLDNDDATAANLLRAVEEAGLARGDLGHVSQFRRALTRPRIPTGGADLARRSPLRSRSSGLPDRARMPRQHLPNIERHDLVVWNAVPWFVGTRERGATPSAAELRLGRTWLTPFLTLLPRLEVVVALGRSAQAAVPHLSTATPALGGRRFRVLLAPHPSQRVYNRPGFEGRARVHAALAEAAAALRP